MWMWKLIEEGERGDHLCFCREKRGQRIHYYRENNQHWPIFWRHFAVVKRCIKLLAGCVCLFCLCMTRNVSLTTSFFLRVSEGDPPGLSWWLYNKSKSSVQYVRCGMKWAVDGCVSDQLSRNGRWITISKQMHLFTYFGARSNAHSPWMKSLWRGFCQGTIQEQHDLVWWVNNNETWELHFYLWLHSGASFFPSFLGEVKIHYSATSHDPAKICL